MIGRKFILSILAGGAVMAPLFVFGHACEFLVARLEVKGDILELEITADYGGNPFIADEAEARQAVKGILELRSGEQARALEDLAPLRMELRSDWDPEAPTAFAPAPDGQPHQLLTAVWKWQTDADEVTLTVPAKNGHDVLLWTRDEKLAGKQDRWMMLIEGESSPVIRLERPGRFFWMASGVAISLLGAFGVWWIRQRCERN